MVRHVSHGEGQGGYDYLVVKPKAANIETTMTVGTDRRVYYLRLRSTEDKFVTRVAFCYPAEVAAKALQEQASLLKLKTLVPDLPATLPPPPPPVKPWKYTVKSKGRDVAYLIPLSMGDDGAHTHIRLSEQARVRGLPVLQIRDAFGPIPANSHWDENTLIVDALFENGCLLEGVGRKQQRVCIHNDSLATYLLAWRSPSGRAHPSHCKRDESTADLFRDRSGAPRPLRGDLRILLSNREKRTAEGNRDGPDYGHRRRHKQPARCARRKRPGSYAGLKLGRSSGRPRDAAHELR